MNNATHRKGQVAIVGTLLVVIIGLMVGLYVYAAVDSAINESDIADYDASQYNASNPSQALYNGTNTSATYDSLITNTNSAFTLTSILPLVIGAACILGVIIGGAFLKGKL